MSESLQDTTDSTWRQSAEARFQHGGHYLLGMEVVHTSEQGPRTAGFHIHQTSAGGQDIQFALPSSAVLPTDWVVVRDSPTVVRSERVAVAVEVDTEEEFQGTVQEAADNTGVPGVAEGS